MPNYVAILETGIDIAKTVGPGIVDESGAGSIAEKVISELSWGVT